MNNYDGKLNDLISNLDGVVYARGQYKGYDLTTYIQPDGDSWEHVISVKIKIENAGHITSDSVDSYDDWEDAFWAINDLIDDQNLQAFAPTLELKSVGRVEKLMDELHDWD